MHERHTPSAINTDAGRPRSSDASARAHVAQTPRASREGAVEDEVAYNHGRQEYGVGQLPLASLMTSSDRLKPVLAQPSLILNKVNCRHGAAVGEAVEAKSRWKQPECGCGGYARKGVKECWAT